MSQDHVAAAQALSTLERTVWASDDADRVELLARLCAGLHGIEPLARPSALGASRWSAAEALAWRERSDLDERTRASAAFAERFSLDVAAVHDDDRSALGAAAGAATGDVVFQLYVLDMAPRVAAACTALLDPGDVPPAPDAVADPAGLWSAIDAFITVVALAQRLDVVTSEVVRLRGARQHRCRKCQSLRSRSALVAGADESLFDEIDRYRSLDASRSSTGVRLDDRQRAALGIVDTMIWTPGRFEPEVVAAARASLDPAERLEVVLDVMRNGANKIAVALDADAADVDEGYEVYDLGPDGVPVYGLSAP
jgi:alkylhydroperoxidase family enzyme